MSCPYPWPWHGAAGVKITVRAALWLNYLLHGARVTRPEQIENAAFREYLRPLYPGFCFVL